MDSLADRIEDFVRPGLASIGDACADTWTRGYRGGYHTGTKVFADVAVAGGLVALAVAKPSSLVAEALLVTVLGNELAKPFMMRDGSVLSEFVNPVVAIGGFALSYAVWANVRELSLLLSVLSVPNVTSDVAHRAADYHRRMGGARG